VFNTSSGKFVCRDKYYGNKLDTTGLRTVLHQFFHDGNRTRHELLVPVLKRLRSIRSILEQLRTYRFYASSLLIMYDGDPQNGSDQSAWSTSKNTSSEKEQLSNKDASLPLPKYNDSEKVDPNRINASCSSSNFKSCEECHNRSASPPHIALDSEEECGKDIDSQNIPNKNNHEDSENHVRVDIRMIDFAKSTHQDMDSTVVHDGPDHGYIFGLTNLIKILKEFLNPSAATESTSSEDLKQ